MSLFKKVWKTEEKKHFLRPLPNVFFQCIMYYCSNPIVHKEGYSFLFFPPLNIWLFESLMVFEICLLSWTKIQSKGGSRDQWKEGWLRAGEGLATAWVLAHIYPEFPFPQDKELFPHFYHFRVHGIVRAALWATQAHCSDTDWTEQWPATETSRQGGWKGMLRDMGHL